MRRLTSRDEGGTVAVWVALSIVPILLCLAFVVDAGIAYWERGQLQNGADAAALAVAQDCIRDSTKCSIATASPGASSVAALNANDSRAGATVTSFTGDSTTGTASVRATTLSGSGTTLELPILSQNVSGSATASVKWGVPSRGSVIPYVIGTCEFTDARLLSGQEVVIENTNRTTCPLTGSPGGFGWLNSTGSTPCQVTISVSGWVQGDTGSWGSNSNCEGADLTPFLCSTILVPIYDRTARNPDGTGVPTGTNVYYHIEKFAAFQFNGWRQSGGNRAGCSGVPQLFGVSGNPNSGIQGHFVRFVALDETFELGSGGASGGVVVVRMTG